MSHQVRYPRWESRPAIPCIFLISLFFLAACSRDSVPEHAVMLPPSNLPDTELGYVAWAGGDRKVVRRVACEFDDSFYVMTAEGQDFELRVGFWGLDAGTVSEIDFEQADSVELKAVDEDLHFYRYTILRILSEMGPVEGSDAHARGKTRLRSTSQAALAEHGPGVEIDFEFSCPSARDRRASGS